MLETFLKKTLDVGHVRFLRISKSLTSHSFLIFQRQNVEPYSSCQTENCYAFTIVRKPYFALAVGPTPFTRKGGAKLPPLHNSET